MVFIMLCCLLSTLVTLVLIWFTTQRRIVRHWSMEGPRQIGDNVQRRNRVVLFVVFGALAVLAFFEAVLADLGYAIQDLQGDVFLETVPGWAIVHLGQGSISWALYLAVFLGVVAGLLFGTFKSFTPFVELKNLRLLDVL